MYLVLLRHGQAEDATDFITDENRKLTEAGIRALRATLPTTFGLLPAQGKITVWTSPLVRARQTADIALAAIEDTCGKKRLTHREPLCSDSLADIEIEDALVELGNYFKRCTASFSEPGDGADLSDDRASKLAQLEDETLVLVGHNPQMGLLAKHLSDNNVHFKKGALACLYFDSDAVLRIMDASADDEMAASLDSSGQVRWFVQGPMYKRWKTLIELEDILKRGFDKVRKEFSRFIDSPEDPDAVHDLRVAIRTLRSLVSFVGPYQKEKQNRKMQEMLRSIVRKLSQLREYDVLIEKAADVDIDLGSPVGELVPPEKLNEQLDRRREKEQGEVLRTLSRRGTEQLKDLDKEFSHITWRSDIEKRGLSLDELNLHFDDMATDFFASYHALDLSDADRTHKVRKRAKQVRYVASKMKPLLGDKAETVTEMKAIQDQLGELCDARVNTRMLGGLVQEGDKLSDVARWQAGKLLVKEQGNEQRILDELAEKRDTAEDGGADAPGEEGTPGE
ncbi:MAG: CHAD domain-containing protein [Coriobacteriales bacterium]|jgi:CHAD domain-containing protein/phosphohistidine phosphatase SixA